MIEVDGLRRCARSLLVALSAAAVAAGACGAVTPAADEQQVLCATGNCDGGSSDGAPRDDGPGARGAGPPVSTEKIVPPCTICRRAENCCKAQGLAGCGYTAACTNAPTNQQTDYYLALCRAVLGAPGGSRRAPDACGP